MIDEDLIAFVYGKALASTKYLAYVAPVSRRTNTLMAKRKYILTERAFTLVEQNQQFELFNELTEMQVPMLPLNRAPKFQLS